MSSVPDIISPSTKTGQAESSLSDWCADANSVTHDLTQLPAHLMQLHVPFCLIKDKSDIALALGGTIALAANDVDTEAKRLLAICPIQTINALGDATFCQDYQIDYPYMAGSMANGIASVELVEALANAGMLASFGAAGLTLNEVETAIKRLQSSLGDKPYCFNLIYSPNEKGHEEAIVDLYIKYGVTLVETSAYMKLTLPVVKYRVKGIHKDSNGDIVVPNRIIAKASRIELAEKWFSPPPEKLLQQLLEQGEITAEEAELAQQIPMAQDLTVEAETLKELLRRNRL